MTAPKVLIVCERFQAGEKLALGEALLEAAVQTGLTKDSIREAFKDGEIVMEELYDKEFAASLTVEPLCSQIGRVLVVGAKAYDKISIQHIDKFKVQRIPQPRSWDPNMRADTVKMIVQFLKGWSPKAFNSVAPVDVRETLKPAENKVGVAGQDKSGSLRGTDIRGDNPLPETANTGTGIPEARIPEKIELDALERFLQVELSNSRLQACVFNWSKDGGTLQLKNAGLMLEAEISGLVPVLIGEDVLKDEKKMKSIRDSLDKSGYKNPYLMPLHEFMMMCRCYQIMAKERKLLLELVS